MIKTLLGSLREYKHGSILTILLSVLEAAFEILIPLRMADLIDQGIDLGDMAAVWKFGIAILILAALQLLTGVLSAHIAAKTSVGFSANLRQDMYRAKYLDRIIELNGTPDIKIITGIRRSGKSKLMQAYIAYLKSNFENINIIFIDFMDLAYNP